MAADTQDAVGLVPPSLLLFDWHGTLVDTLDAMYHAVDDMLARLETLSLTERLVASGRCKTVEDARLVDYVRLHRRLHPKIKSARRVSRTDLFEILFGDDDEAKDAAHAAFNASYRDHYGEVRAMQAGEREILERLRAAGRWLGIVSNRDREFLEHELAMLDNGRWRELFDVIVCGGDAPRRKPAPDPILHAIAGVGLTPGPACWYVGDSASDVTAAKGAGITSVFFNSARWDAAWLGYYFPRTVEHPHAPDLVVADFEDLLRRVESLSAVETRAAPIVAVATAAVTPTLEHGIGPR